jgi:filamentous hemagglutinin family protein
MKFNLATLTLHNKIIVFLSIILGLITNNTQVLAQNITTVNDGTNTIVNIDGNTFNITGGSLSGDGTNLFHSLEQFGLTSEQIANFLSNPNINNILTRIVGGSPSFIDGLIQVTGGNSNLFLMNPAGMVFGSNASLNLLGDFTATTATGIGFNNNWFNAIGDNNYANLIGNPSSFAFDLTENGTIINLGNLEVAKGQNLTLLGGTVINTGNLTAREGNINIISIPGTSKIALSQPGDVMSIVFETPRDTNGNILPFKATDIPTLITQGVTGLAINNNGEVTVNNTTIETGDIFVNNLEANTANLLAINNLKLVESQLNTTGDLNLFAENTLFIRDSIENPFNALVGGNLYIQGNQGIDILALNHLDQTPFISGGNTTLVSDGIISTDGHFQSGNNFSILNLSGNPANFTSLYDPIIIQPGNYTSGGYTGASLKVDTTSGTGNITFTGEINISGVDNNYIGYPPGTDEYILGNFRALILRSGSNINLTSINRNTPAGGDQKYIFLKAQGNIITGDIEGSNFGGSAGDIIIQAEGDIQTGGLRSIDVSIPDPNQDIKGGDITVRSNQGSVSITGNLASFSNDNGGTIKIDAVNNINIECTVTTYCIQSFSGGNPDPNISPVGTAGDVILTSQNGSINVTDISGIPSGENGFIDAGNGASGNPGNITINAKSDINLGSLAAYTSSNNGGIITINSREGSVNLNAGNNGIKVISYTNISNNGTLNITAAQDINTGRINPFSNNGNGTNINLTSTNGGKIDTTAGTINTSSANGNGGGVVFNTTGLVNLGNIITNC